jgi:hypothetical protein
MNHSQIIQLLFDNGYTYGWEMVGDSLTVWEHDEDPPTPLTRPEAPE